MLLVDALASAFELAASVPLMIEYESVLFHSKKRSVR
jgi:hypothetical protein